MLEKPDIQDQYILSHVQEQYGLPVALLTFLPLGVDINAAVYRAVTRDGTAYFLKLRKGFFDETSVAVPLFLKEKGIEHIIAPLTTRTGQAWGNLDVYRTILYPFIQGKDGYEVQLSDQQWIEFGIALKGMHTAQVPSALKRLIQQETFSSHWREMVTTFQAQAENTSFTDPAAARLAIFMKQKHGLISHMVGRAEQLGLDLKTRRLRLVLCHSDIHPGNLLIGAKDAFYIVDWDNPILAPKERDLMSVCMGGVWNGAQQQALFYQGYGQVEMDWHALTYYRFERIIQDIADFCKQLFLTSAGGDDREQSFQYLAGSFLPDNVVDAALKTDHSWTR
jgi:spectinomycin phosphotransferase